jgi:hypothetical protein
MTQDEIIEMAKEAGLIDADYEIGQWDIHEVTAFAKLAVYRHASKVALQIIGAAVVAEREALCKAMEDKNTWDLYDPASTAIQVIRARGQA